MAKELPYFQFEPAEYLTKDVSFCSLSAQGLFVNLCSYYWQRQCKLTKPQFLRRLNNPDEFQELIDEGVIDIQNDVIKIKFLDAQLDKATKSSKTNSINGSKGGRPRKEKLIKTEIKPTDKPKLNPIKSETKGIREDKIIEEEINNIYNKFVDEVKAGGFDSKKELLYKNLKIKDGSLTPLVKEFKAVLIQHDRVHKTTQDLYLNFFNWLNTQDRLKKLDKYKI